MNTKKSMLALLAVLVLALCVGPATVAATDGGAEATASKSKKKGKKNKKSCKGKKGKAKKKCKKGKRGGSKGSAGKLANGLYEDAEAELAFKVSGGGSKIQVKKVSFFRGCPVALQFGYDTPTSLKTSGGSATASQSFTLSGGAITKVDWSVKVNVKTLAYSAQYTLNYEIPSPEAPVRCQSRESSKGTLSR